MSVNDELIDRYLDGDVTHEEAHEVLAWLELPGNLERFARRAELCVDLPRSLRRRRIQSDALAACKKDRSGGRSRRVVAMGVVALATATCLLIALALSRGEHNLDPSQPALAKVVSEINAVLIKDESTWRQSDLVAGEYQLEQGLLHLQFDGGVMVYVEAPAKFDAVSGKRIVLQSGRLSANVPPEGVGFTVETSKAEVVDFGTEFSIEVQDASSEVHVFNGLVRVQPRGGANISNDTIDLRTSQAVRIDDTSPNPVDIKLATDRFIRDFDEPKLKYARSVKQLGPVAFYRMPIRDRGLVSEPPQYSGVVLTGDGKRPPHARGVFIGGSLRVRADSTGRGGRVNSPPPLETGAFTMAVFVYLESPAAGGTVATNIRGNQGNFGLSLDESGRPQATVRNREGELKRIASDTVFPPTTWLHLVMTADGDQLRLFENGRMVTSTRCDQIARSGTETMWFGTDADPDVHRERGLWNGRIDELALFDKALTEKEIADLYQAALDERERIE